MRYLATFSLILSSILAVSASADTITLRLHTFNSPQSLAVRSFLEPWSETIAEASQGQVQVQIFPAMQLGGRPADLYGQVRDGVVDLVWTVPGYSPGRFPLSEVFELPFVCGNAEATSQAFMALYSKWLRDEYDDTRPLVFHSTAPGHLHTAGSPIREVEDLAGLKIRVASTTHAAALEALGAVPIGMPIPNVYEAVSRGVVDGIWVPWTIMRPFRLHEVTPAHTETYLGCALFVLTMNKARYLELPETTQKILDEASGMPLAKKLGRLWQDDEMVGRDLAVERDHTIVSLSEEERARWQSMTQPVTNAWLTKVNALGYDGEAILADAKQLVAKYSNTP